MKHALTLTASLALLAPALAWAAGGKATLESSDGQQRLQSTLEYDGRGALRMTAGQDPNQYLLHRDGKVYSVFSQDGTPLVVEMGAMLKTLGGMAQQNAGQQPLAGDVAEFRDLRDTGRTETVAGIKGRVHELSYVDSQGRARTESLVLSSDGRARELTQTLFAFGEAMAAAAATAEPAGSRRLETEIVGGNQGVLRFGTQFRVLAFDGSTPSAARFELPAAPTQMPDLGGMMPGGAGANPLGTVLGQKAERQQQRVEDRANQEVDEATDTAVDKALDKAFDKLFGR